MRSAIGVFNFKLPQLLQNDTLRGDFTTRTNNHYNQLRRHSYREEV